MALASVKEAKMIPTYHPHELCSLSDAELNALFDYVRQLLIETNAGDPERVKALDLLDDIRADMKLRITRCLCM